jgi:hypothetical protein
MPTTPEFTLTATLEDLTGAAAGSTANPAKLRICLCGFGPALPRIAGTTMVAKCGPTDFFSTGAALSIELWGNDQITPAGTYYSIEILDGEDNVVQCGAYVLTGSGGDLSSLPPVNPLPPSPQMFGLVMVQLAGTVPGTAFKLPAPAWMGVILGIFYKGVFYPAAGNWSLAGLIVTMTFACTQEPYALYVEAI